MIISSVTFVCNLYLVLTIYCNFEEIFYAENANYQNLCEMFHFILFTDVHVGHFLDLKESYLLLSSHT